MRGIESRGGTLIRLANGGRPGNAHFCVAIQAQRMQEFIRFPVTINYGLPLKVVDVEKEAA
jgi:hypothetical protein